jgi:hypothetical protein
MLSLPSLSGANSNNILAVETKKLIRVGLDWNLQKLDTWAEIIA